MKSVFKALMLSFVLLFSFAAFGIETKFEQHVAMEAVLAELKTHYGMIKFKEQAFGINYDDVAKKYRRLIDTATMLEEDAGLRPRAKREVLLPEEFRQLLIGLAAEFKDGHTNILRASGELWTLGIRTAAIGGRLYVVGFNDNFFNPNSTFPQLQIGDEVTAVDGRPVEQIARENALYMSLATENSRQTRALEMVLNVPHRWLMAKQTGAPVSVTFQRDGKPIQGNFHWVSAGAYADLSALSHYVLPEKSPAQSEKERLTERPYIYGESSTTKTYFSEGLKKAGLKPGQLSDLGKLLNMEITEAKKKKEAGLEADAQLAELAPVTRMAAYTIRHEGKTFGVLRVPSYSPEGGFEAAVNELRWLAQTVARMEHATDALIIDQLGNGGGYVYEFAQFVRLFANKGEMATAMMDVKLSQTFFNAHSAVPTPENDYEKPVEGVKRNYGRMITERAALQKMQEAFARGEKWSGWVSFFGGSHELMPNEMGRVVALPDKVYTKPVLLLNDGRSASGGDFMPAAMQAAGRAVVMGETSMGLGGPVYRGQESMPGSEVFMRCTMGYCIRADGLPIENIGVVPEVKRAVELSDVKNGFGDYAKDVLTAAAKLAGGVDAKVIDTDLNTELVKRANPKNEPLTAEAGELIRYIAEFKARGYHKKAPIEGTLARYRELAKLTQRLHAGVKPHEWRAIDFPLPEILLERDMLLASMTDKRGTMGRLAEMARHPYYGQNAKALELVTATKAGLEWMGADARINDCLRLLVKR